MSPATASTEASRAAGAAPASAGPAEPRADESRQSQPGRAWTILREAVACSKKNNVTMIAQALAYSFFLAIPPICLVVLGVFSLVASPADVRDLVDGLGRVMPAEATTLLRQSLERSTQSTGSGLVIAPVGFALALWATTSATATLMQGVTTAFGRDDERGFVHKRVLALLLVACFLAAALLVVGLLVSGPYVNEWVGDAIGAPGATAWVWWTAQWPI